MSIDIANCPFCGAKASIQTQFGVDHWVQCESDTCASTNGKTTTSRRHAIDSWNRRATPQAPTPAAAEGQAEAARENLALVIARLEQIVATEGEFNENLVDWAKEALPCANALAAPLPRQAAVRDHSVKYELRMRAPNGRCEPWSETNSEMYARYTENSDIGDGFTYETRALIVTPQTAPDQVKSAPATTERDKS